LFFGVPYQIAGLLGVKLILLLCYTVIARGVYEVASSINRSWGLAALALFLLNLPFLKWYFAIDSETLQSILVVWWFWFMFRNFYSSSVGSSVIHGVLLVLLVLTRPNNQVFILATLLPLLNRQATWTKRIVQVSLTAAIMLGGIGLYSFYNLQRYGDFTVARLGNAHLPFYRLYLQNHAISPENGPASARLGRIMEDYLKSTPAMKQYNITEEKLYRAATSRLFAHVLAAVHLSDGWESDYALLRSVGIEAIKKDPVGSLMGFIDQLGEVFYFSDKRFFTFGPLKLTNEAFRAIKAAHIAELSLKDIPPPNEDEMVSSQIWQLQFKPENYTASDETVLGIKFQAVPWTTESAGILRSLPKWVDYFCILLGPNGVTLLLVMVGLLLSSIAAFKGSGSVDFRIPLLVGLASISLIATLMASVQREFRYPYDPLFCVMFVWAADQIWKATARASNTKRRLDS
jgi:hypothetical protein